MKLPSFQTRFAALLVHVALLSGQWRSASRRNRGMMTGPPGYPGTGFIPGGSGGGTVSSQVSAPLPGIASSTQGLPAVPNPVIQQGSGTSIPFYLQSQRYTSATALTPTAPGMFLVDVAAEGGNNPGSYSITYAPNGGVAHFLAPSSGTDATGLIGAARVIHYPVSWALNSTNIGSGNTAFNATSATNMAVTVTFSTMSFGGPDISVYRACHAKGSETGTSGTSRTFTFDASPAVGRAMVVVFTGLATATGIPQGNVAMPTIGGYGQQIPAQGPTSTPQIVPIQPMPSSSTLVTTFTATTLGGSTNVNFFALVYY